MELRTPLLLDGDVTAFLYRAGMPPDESAPQWMLSHPSLVEEAAAAFVAAGADLLCAPTALLNTLRYAGMGGGEGSGAAALELSRALTMLTAKAADKRILTAAAISTTGQLPEPFGPIPYRDMVDIFAEQAQALKEGGAQLLLIRDMPSLAEARAAVLGARQTGLPLLVSLRLEARGSLPAALICLQELGIAAFGVNYIGDSDEVAEQLRRLAPYAKVPLLAGLDARFGENEGQVFTAQAYGQNHLPLIEAGARICGGGADVAPEHIAVLRGLLHSPPLPPLPAREESGKLLADEAGTYILREGYSLSKEIACEVDMSAAILEAEEDGADLLLFRIAGADDASFLGQNAHLCHTAVCLRASSAQALEEALFLYCGRAMIDSRSALEREELLALAGKYGALLH